MYKKITTFFSASILAYTSLTACAIAADNDPEALKQAFISNQLANGFTQAEINDFLGSSHRNQAVLDAISKPWEAKPWYQYHPIFLTEKRLQKGLEFWRENAGIIDKAAKKFQVDPQMIVAIIGIETFYGGYLGKYKVQDALYTLGFYYPPRAKFFRSEYANLMSLVKEEKLNKDTLVGSYAGAMGYGQFIPSSYRHYAVDFNGDGRRDLLGSKADAIGSVANYFHQHGWKMGAQVALEMNYKGNDKPKADVWKSGPSQYKVSDIISPDLSLKKAKDIDVSQKALLVKLQQQNSTEYWLGLNNFYVITRYNRSPLYAMAAYQFSQQLKAAYNAN